MIDIDWKKLKRLLPFSPGIMGKEEYVNCAVLIPIVCIGGEYNLLFEKRSGGIRQGGEICFPGGKFDPSKDDDLTDTALRETLEETGIARKKIKVIGRLDTHIAALGTAVEPVIARLDGSYQDGLNINKNEVEKVFVIPLDFFKDNPCETYQAVLMVHPEIKDKEGNIKTLFPAKELGLPEKYRSPWGGHEHKIYVYKTPYGVIWGITARLIRELLDYMDNI